MLDRHSKNNTPSQLLCIKLMDEAFAMIGAPLPRTVDEWADENRILPPGSAEPGPWRSSRTPYMIEPVRAFKNPQYNRVIWVMGSQMGKTANQFNVMGQRLDDDPAPCLYIGPTQSNIRNTIEPKIAAMIEESPSLMKKFNVSKSTKTVKLINGMALRMAWAGSATELASDSAAIVMIDERDRMESSVKGEGDPVELGEARAATYPDGTVGVASTPTEGNVETYEHPKTKIEHWKPSNEIASPIWRLWQEGTRHEWAWPCPECDEFFIPRFKWVKWPKDSTPDEAFRLAHMVCPTNGCIIESKHRTKMNSKGTMLSPGEYMKDGKKMGESDTKDSDTASYWISGLCSFSAKKSFGYAARRYLKATKVGDPDRIKAVINTELGELFRVAEQKPWETILDRIQPYVMGSVPEGVLLMTAGVDVQKNRLVYAVRGWGIEYESWLIDAGELMGETNKPSVWESLSYLLNKEFKHHNGSSMRVLAMLIDSGYESNQVYQFCRKHPQQAFATKGRDTMTSDLLLSKVTKFDNIPLVNFKTDPFKSWVHARVEWPKDKPGGWWVPSDVEEDYCRQVLSESKIIKPSGGTTWVKTYSQNHYWDAEVLNYLAIKLVRPIEVVAATTADKSRKYGTISKGVE